MGPNTGHYYCLLVFFLSFFFFLGITPFFNFSTEQLFIKRGPVACAVAVPKVKCKPEEFRPLGVITASLGGEKGFCQENQAYYLCLKKII